LAVERLPVGVKLVHERANVQVLFLLTSKAVR